MSLPIRQGATHKVVLGPFVDVGDGFTPETGVLLSSADDAEAILHDNGTVVDISGYTWAAITTADGYYHLTLQSGISNTVGHLTIIVQDDSVCLPVKADFIVLDTGIYDSIYADAAASLATEAKQDIMDTNIDQIETAVITNAAGADIAADIIAVKAETAAIVNDTDLIDDGTSGLAKIATDVAAILNDTDLIDDGTSGLAKIATDVAAILVDTNELQTDDIPGDIAALNNISAANVATEISDALRTDTLTATPQGAPPTTPTIQEALMILYDALVHKVDVDASQKEFYNNAGTVIWKKALSDDGSNYVEAESATGP